MTTVMIEGRRGCLECDFPNWQHLPECSRAERSPRMTRLTAAGNRKAFEQSLERIMQHTHGVLR